MQAFQDLQRRVLARHAFSGFLYFFLFCCLRPVARKLRSRLTARSIPAGCRGSPAPRKFSPARRARSSRRRIRSRRPPIRSTRRSLPKAGRNTSLRTLSAATNENQRTLSLKKGPLALGVFITVAPAQGNATSVQYNAVPLKNDVPFPKDATNIEFDPNRPLLTLVSAEPIDKTLDFYRKELAPARLVAVVAKTQRHSAGGRRVRRADQKRRLCLLPAGRPAAGGTRSGTRRGWPDQGQVRRIAVGISGDPAEGIFQQRQYRRGAGRRRPFAPPRWREGRQPPVRRRTRWFIRSQVSLANTVAATRQMLAADGWKQYVAPLESQQTLLPSKRDRRDCRCHLQFRWAKTTRPAKSPPSTTRRSG